MYYSSGSYEAFARARKPEGVEDKAAWFVGAGLASMASAAFMIRDGQMDGSKITVLERLTLPGGALDGIEEPKKGFVIRGGREVDDHYECLWDLYRSIPSIEVRLVRKSGPRRSSRSGRISLSSAEIRWA
jgi:oleate hydratase